MINKLFGHFLFIIISLKTLHVQSESTTSLKKTTNQELDIIERLKIIVNNKLIPNELNFYNYSIVCGRDVDAFARVDKRVSFIDQSIPEQYRDLTLSTYVEDTDRFNKCPKWSPNIDTSPQSGSMGSIKIPENTPIGQTVYFLSALSDEPLFYFMRLAETETDMMFKVTTLKTNGFIGMVQVKEKLDYEKKKSYTYLVYAFDGANLIERLSIVDVMDVDDEPPVIDIKNSNYNILKKRFEFKIFENSSVGYILNSESPIGFFDIDTQQSQLKINIVNSLNSLNDVPFSLSVSGKITLTSSIDYETQADYLLKIVVKVNIILFLYNYLHIFMKFCNNAFI
jgi:hypothetical protein